MALNSIHFGTENLVFVPEGQCLTFLDLYHWRSIRLESHAAGLRLRAHSIDHVKHSCQDLLARYLKTPDGRANRGAIERDTERFLTDLIDSARGPESMAMPAAWLGERSAPAHLTLWARLSDVPLETYFEEDYDPPPVARSPGVGLPLYGSIVISRLGEGEILLPEGGDSAGFLLEFPTDREPSSVSLDPGSPLPILQEFCGSGGASNQGNAANYTLDSRLARDKLGCVPLHRLGRTGFATLYAHLETEPTYNVSIRIRGGARLRLAEKKITLIGYRVRAEGDTFRIWEREATGDVLHVYFGIPGRESEMVPYLSPFVLAAQASGGFDPAGRSRLIGELAAPSHPSA